MVTNVLLLLANVRLEDLNTYVNLLGFDGVPASILLEIFANLQGTQTRYS